MACSENVKPHELSQMSAAHSLSLCSKESQNVPYAIAAPGWLPGCTLMLATRIIIQNLQLHRVSRFHEVLYLHQTCAPQQELDRKEQKKDAETQDVGPGDDTDNAPTNQNLSDSATPATQLVPATGC